MNTPVLGLELGGEYLAAVVLQPCSRQPRLAAAAVMPCPAGEEARVLPQLLQRLGWRRGRVAIGLAPGIVSFRRISLPFAHADQIAKVMSQELADQFPWSPDDLATTHRTIRQGPQGSLVMALALRHSFLSRLQGLLHGLGVTASHASSASMALAGLAAGRTSESGTVLLVHAAEGGLTLALLRGNEVQALRELPLPADWRQQCLRPGPDGIFCCRPEAACCHSAVLLEGIRATLTAWRLQDGDQHTPPSHLLLGGWLATLAPLQDAWSRELELSPISWSVMAVAETPPCEADLCPLVERSWALALLHGHDAANLRLPLPSPPGLPLPRNRPLRLSLLLAAGLVLIGLAALSIQAFRLQAKNQRLDKELASLLLSTFPATGKVVDPLQQFLAQMQATRGSGGSQPELSPEPRALHTLAELSRALGQDSGSRLSSFALERDTVLLRGEAPSYRAVQVLRDRLAAIPAFTEVVIVSAASGSREQGAGRILFQLKFRLRAQT